MLGLLLTMAVIGACSTAALVLQGPNWARWTLVGLALAGTASLGIAFMIGPLARRLAGETAPLTPAERRQMSVVERVEAVNAARSTLIQAATGLVVIGGVVFTVQGLRYTAESLKTSRQAQLTAEQGQITDRYTKAVEQLGSSKQDVRLGGIYALQRLTVDSPRDRETIRNVLAAYVRGHDTCTPQDRKGKPPEQCTAKTLSALAEIPIMRPGADVLAALTIAPALAAGHSEGIPPSTGDGTTDFSQVRFPRTYLRGAYLRNANLSDANLRGADLSGAYLRDADLVNANLRGANLRGADLVKVNLGSAYLRGADLSGAHLRDAYVGGANLRRADLSSADLRGALVQAYLSGADLSHADLRGAYLFGADLCEADLTKVRLTGAQLRGADLRFVRGMTEKEIRTVAVVDATTRF
ncbi:pentapeptide repeat-containing protein [Microbispora sp. H10949]|uniref:pentapeptide repeat-containing protein n=1 Tax=Microbispora sp. H10949 TaxID=2729111 RepID=UPI001600AA4A|nr:pentapeptide repeat-containing protein [Microbispora sp. H10949]